MNIHTVKIIFGLSLMIVSFDTMARQHPVANSFKQSIVDGGGNCASIAGIKTAMARYGGGNVFRLEKAKDTLMYTASLRSGVVLFLTPQEIEQVAKASGFKRFNIDPVSLTMMAYADTCFAVMCKNLQNRENELRAKNKIVLDALLEKKKTASLKEEDNKRLAKLQGLDLTQMTLQGSIDQLNDGATLPNVASLLGVELIKIKATVKNIKKNEDAMMNNIIHAVYTSKGVYDEPGARGGVSKLRNFRWKRMSCKCAFFFCGPSSAYVIK